MAENKHIIIFSHGFGVGKDDRGLFTDIADALKNVEAVMFDYSDIDEAKNQTTVRPFSEQAKLLESHLADAKASNPSAVVDIICHSQGAVAASLANLTGARKVIFIAPPFASDATRMMKMFQSRPGTKIDLAGMSILARSGGSTTLVPAEYWAEREKTNLAEIYRRLSESMELTIINAKQDNVVGVDDFSSLNQAEIINLDGNHDFSGADRKKLLEVIGSKIN
jgi:hypothetical protein